jgi:predicted SAM-dependent methyltransferase
MKEQYVNFGCGVSCPPEFTNFDGSFNLRMQRSVIVGGLIKKMSSVRFPDNALYADIVKGLPVKNNSLKGIFSSHILEHLALNELRTSLRNCYDYLQPGGIFRAVLPNLEEAIQSYVKEKLAGNKEAAINFMSYTFLGYEKRPTSVMDLLKWRLSGHHHFWMWDFEALQLELMNAGFTTVYRSGFNKSIDAYFNHAEFPSRFDYNALCIEAIK